MDKEKEEYKDKIEAL